ncbi:MAG: amidase [Planctomycetota bacterium]|nr:amidase [Planctomycetota bacterium]
MTAPSLGRRSFLLAAGAAPLAAPLAARRLRGLDDPDDMAAFGRLIGLRFSDTETAQAERSLAGYRRDYEALRASDVSFDLPPSTAFDPFPQAQARPAPTRPHRVEIPTDTPLPAAEVDLAFSGVLELASLLRQKLVTSRRLTELALSRLKRFDPTLHCVVNLLEEQALNRADELDAELAAGKDRGPLHGIPYGAKDLFAWPGAPTTFGAKPYAEQRWDVEATCLARLRDAGAVLCAKLSLGALAMGDLWHGGRTRNPYNPAQGSSGSSAGSASAVAAGLVPFAIGTETLGSIVSPCRRCGVGGLRPTFGAVSRYGAMPLSWTMDKVGPIARTATCAGVVFDAMRGADGRDPSARDTGFAWRRSDDLKGLKVGVLALNGWPRSDAHRGFLRWLEDKASAPRTIQLPDAPYGAMLLVLHAEAAAAFDELTRSGKDDELPGQRAGDWPNAFRSARTIPAVEYLQASRTRTRLLTQMRDALADVDVLVSPTHGGPLLTATNLSGHPTMVLPVGRSGRETDGGRPELIALTGQLDGEGPLLQVAAAWQNETAWHTARPELTDR